MQTRRVGVGCFSLFHGPWLLFVLFSVTRRGTSRVLSCFARFTRDRLVKPCEVSLLPAPLSLYGMVVVLSFSSANPCGTGLKWRRRTNPFLFPVLVSKVPRFLVSSFFSTDVSDSDSGPCLCMRSQLFGALFLGSATATHGCCSPTLVPSCTSHQVGGMHPCGLDYCTLFRNPSEPSGRSSSDQRGASTCTWCIYMRSRYV